jgi:hypothetical protein
VHNPPDLKVPVSFTPVVEKGHDEFYRKPTKKKLTLDADGKNRKSNNSSSTNLQSWDYQTLFQVDQEPKLDLGWSVGNGALPFNTSESPRNQ